MNFFFVIRSYRQIQGRNDHSAIVLFASYTCAVQDPILCIGYKASVEGRKSFIVQNM